MSSLKKTGIIDLNIIEDIIGEYVYANIFVSQVGVIDLEMIDGKPFNVTYKMNPAKVSIDEVKNMLTMYLCNSGEMGLFGYDSKLTKLEPIVKNGRLAGFEYEITPSLVKKWSLDWFLQKFFG